MANFSAVSAEYEDVAESCVGIESASGSNFLDSVNDSNTDAAGENIGNKEEMEVEVGSELSEELDKLGGMLMLNRQGESDCTYLRRICRHIKLTITPGSLHALKTEGMSIPLEFFSLRLRHE